MFVQGRSTLILYALALGPPNPWGICIHLSTHKDISSLDRVTVSLYEVAANQLCAWLKSWWQEMGREWGERGHLQWEFNLFDISWFRISTYPTAATASVYSLVLLCHCNKNTAALDVSQWTALETIKRRQLPTKFPVLSCGVMVATRQIILI